MKNVGERLIASMEEALAHAEGRPGDVRETVIRVTVPVAPDVAAIRHRLGLSRAAFAARFGFSPATLRKWESGDRQPEGPARAYLTVIDRDPEAVERALRVA